MDIQVTPHNKLVRSVEVLTPGVSDDFTNVLTPATITVYPTGGTAQVEYTNDPAKIVWKVWPKGAVGAVTDDRLVASVVALRLNVISGSAVMTIVGGHHV